MRAFVASVKTPITKFSVVIPARNEAANIEACIAGIVAQNYPTHLFEIIVVDDYSEDETAQIVLKIAQQCGFSQHGKINMESINDDEFQNIYVLV